MISGASVEQASQFRFAVRVVLWVASRLAYFVLAFLLVFACLVRVIGPDGGDGDAPRGARGCSRRANRSRAACAPSGGVSMTAAALDCGTNSPRGCRAWSEVYG